MRAALTLFLVLCSMPVAAGEIEFALNVGTMRVARGRVVIPVEVTVPVDQLRFVDDGVKLAARVSVVSIVGGVRRVVVPPRRVTAPRGTEPRGAVTYRFDVVADREATAVSVAVRDETAASEGVRAIAIEGTRARVESLDDGPAADVAWAEVLARAGRERKPIVIFFRSRPCARCREFARVSVPHPAIARRLPAVVFAVLPTDVGEAATLWGSPDAGMAFFDRTGVLRVRWPIVPDTTNFGVILDSVGAVAADFERAAQRIEAGAADDGALDAGVGLARLGRLTDAHAELARARAHGSPAVRQAAAVAEAVLDANAGDGAQALTVLEDVAANAVTPGIAADARAAIEAIHGTQQIAAAPIEHAPIRILPLARQVVSGRQPVRTHVAAAAVARVVFSLDGRDIARVERPPFSATVDFGAVPERWTIGVIAFDRKGRAIGRDARVVNEGGETFWLRLMSPREGSVSGTVRVVMSVRAPAARRVERVVVSWNDARRAVLTAAPWECALEIPAGRLGVLRAVAELDDGRTSEDAVLLNAGGLVDQANVQLVELPLTMMSRNGVMPEVTPDHIVVREGTKLRRVEAVATAAETPLTVGLLIDVSDSMQKTLPDVQEAAIRFLETVLGERDRAFLIAFDTRARLLQPATSDVALLRRQIMSIRPNGLTALHDAMVLGLLQFEGIKGRRALIVFSDGRDITSEYRAADVAALARRVNVPIHVVASVLDTPAALSGDAPPAAASNVDEDLQRIAQSTGGTARALDNLVELPVVYARIEAALRAQVLAFIRTEPASKDNEWRSIRVEVEGKDVDVYAPAGYYAAW